MKQLLLVLSLLFTLTVRSQCSFSLGPNQTICNGSNVQLGGSITYNPSFTYTWSPATGLSDTDTVPVIASPSVNTTYTLTINNNSGCTSSSNVTVNVNPAPTAGFTFAPATACARVPIHFTSTSTGTGLSYAWNFGNPASGSANTSTQQNPSHSFVATGSGTQVFTVTLTVTNSSGCSSVVTHTITISQSPGAALLDPLADMKNCDGSNFNMQVYDQSASGANNNYQVIWGDGSPNFSSSTAPAPASHLYTTSDIFDLYYIVTGNNGCRDTAHYVVSNITNPAIGAANPGGTTGCGPLTLCFPLNNFSANHPSTFYVVDYGDNSPKDTLPHPPPASICHTYSQTSCGRPGNAYIFSIKAINRCDSSEATITPIRIYTAPVASFNISPNPGCTGSPITMNNTSTLGSNSSCSSSTIFNWNFGDGQTATTFTLTSPVHTYAAPGNYTVTLSTSNSCGISTDTKIVCIENPPTPQFSLAPPTGCIPFTTTATNTSNLANTCNVTRVWSVIFNGSTCLPSAGTWSFAGGTNASSLNPQFTFSSAGTYTVRLTLTNSCGSFIYDQIVTAQAPPQVSINPLSSICAGGSVSPVGNVNACYEPADTYSWNFPGGSPSNSAALNPGSVSYANAGSYTITFAATNQCGTSTSNTALTVNPLPPALNPTVNSPLCVGQTANFTSNTVAGVSYVWSGPAGNFFTQNFSIPSVSAAQAGTYTLTGSVGGCTGTPQTVNLVVQPIPVVSVTPSSVSICAGQSTTLTASGATTYSWSPATGLSATSGTTVTANPSATTTYTVTGSNGTCSGTANAIVTVNPLPVVNAGSDTTLCNQPIPVNLTGTPAGGTWSGPNVTSGGTFTPSGTGSFTLTYTYTNANGCTSADNKIITVVAPTPANAGADFAVCADAANVTLSGSPAAGVWSGSGVTSGGIFDPTVAGSFPLVYTFGSGSCLSRDTLIAIVNPLPIVNAGSDFAVCISAGNQALSGTPAGGTWSGTGVSGSNFSPTAAGAGSYMLTYSVTNANGCTAIDQLQAIVNPLPILNAGNDTTLCNQPVPVTFTGTPSGGSWSGPNVTSGGTFTPSGTGSFTLTYSFTNANGCANTDTRIVTVVNPTPANAGSDFAVCADAPNVTLNGNPMSGNWSGTGVTPGGIFDPTAAGTFPLVYSVGAGSCLTRDTLLAIVNPLPLVNAGPDFTVCISAGAQTLTGTPAGGSWTGTGVSASSFNPGTAGVGTFTLTYSFTDGNGCSSSDQIQVIVNPLPAVNAGNDTTLCNQPVPVTFSGSPAGGTWSGPNVTSGGTFTPNGTGTFSLVYTFTNANGCTNTDSKVVTVINPIPANAGADFAVCIDAANVTLSGAPTGGSWTGAGVTSGGIFDPTTAGNFPLVYTIGAGSCLTRDTLNAIVNPLPIVNAGSDFTGCIDAGIQNLTGTPVGGNWTGTAISGTTFNPATAGAGTFVLTYTFADVNGCVASDQLSATVNPLPVVNAGNDTTLCNQPIPVTFFATPAGGVWSGPNISPGGTFTPNGTGTFTITYTFTNTNSCTNSDTKVVTVVAPVQANAGPDFAVCVDGANVVLNGSPLSGIWTGSGVTSGGIFDPTIAGSFPLVYSTGAGTCLTRDTLIGLVNPLPVVNAGPDAGFCPADAIVNFIGSPAGGSWSGSGITNSASGQFDPAIPATGAHNITYTYTNPATGCTNSDILVATIHPVPAPGFSYNPVACVGTPETITDNSTFGSTWNWNFGDGVNSAAPSPTHTWSTAGFFTIRQIVTSAFGCVDSISQVIEVREPPVAVIAIAPDSACGPLTVNFTNTSTGPSVTYSWNFGNGNSSNQQFPGPQTYTEGYLADTNYTVILTATNFCGTDTDQETVTVMPQPHAIFGTNTNIGCSPLTLDFVNNSVGLPDNYQWDFGDGTTSNSGATSFNHIYTTGANDTTYTIQLVVSNECGSDTTTHSITVLPNQVNAFFNTDDPDGCVPHTVNFTQFSTGATVYNWDFGDGNVAATPNATHTFTTAGTYTVHLYVNDGCGYDTADVVITVYPSPVVDFSAQPDSVCIGVDFVFTNLSPNLASSDWDFGDGGTSTLYNPTHAFTASGTYTVTLTGTSQTNGCIASVSHPVVVSTNPVAAFTPDPISGCAPLPVQFQNSSSNVNFQSWDFGDGNFSTAVNPLHTFATDGNYTVTLAVENANGCRDTIQAIVTVYPLPVADFNMSTGNTCYPPVDADFTNTSIGAMNYQWDFGNGNSSGLTNPSETFTAGNYTISLTASNQYGCVDVATRQLDVYNTPIAAFTLPDDTLCVGEVATFVSASSFADSIVWDFGNGEYVSGNQVDYFYPGSGTYPVTIMVYGAGGCGDTLTVNTNITVNPSPIADFEYENIQNPDPLSGTVVFTNTSQLADGFQWFFGNGDTSSVENPTERYNSYGEFLATLVATNQFGCSDTVSKPVKVEFFYGLFIPNAMQPGNSNFEVANFIPKGVGLAEFELLIYDDWGNLIWETHALDADGRPTEFWDGTFNGVPAQQDAYVWKCTATFANHKVWEGKEYGNKLKRSGTVTIIR